MNQKSNSLNCESDPCESNQLGKSELIPSPNKQHCIKYVAISLCPNPCRGHTAHNLSGGLSESRSICEARTAGWIVTPARPTAGLSAVKYSAYLGISEKMQHKSVLM